MARDDYAARGHRLPLLGNCTDVPYLSASTLSHVDTDLKDDERAERVYERREFMSGESL